jgi:hypothetical protein
VRFVRCMTEGVFIEDCGTLLGCWRGKCLQASVLACLCGAVQDRARRQFLKRCANHVGSGSGLCDARALRSLEVVVNILQSARVFVWVLESIRVGEDVVHTCKFRLGDPLGEEVGVLLWFGDENHVVRLCGEIAFRYADTVPEEIKAAGTEGPPWYRGVVGAPKKRVYNFSID